METQDYYSICTGFVSPTTLREFINSNILPVFILKSIKNSELIGRFEGTAIHRPHLAPSAQLFRAKRDGLITVDEFQREYAREMSEVDLFQEILDLEYLARLANTRRIVLLSYGTQVEKCHRMVLGRIINGMGVLKDPVVEYDFTREHRE